MLLLQSEKLLDHVSNIIHKDTQLHERHIDLTVSEIHRLKDAGSLDFGGSEFQPAQTESIQPTKKNPDDKYGWWELAGGTYRAVFNEKMDFSDDTSAIITAHTHTNDAGLISGTKFLSSHSDEDPVSINFHVPEVGCNIKENARFATLHVLSE